MWVKTLDSRYIYCYRPEDKRIVRKYSLILTKDFYPDILPESREIICNEETNELYRFKSKSGNKMYLCLIKHKLIRNKDIVKDPIYYESIITRTIK